MDTVLTLASIRELPDPAGDEALLALLPPERREKLLRLKRPEDRRRSFGAWFLLRAALKELGAEPGPLAYGPQGKPFFPDRPDLHFNLSHSGETVLCALSPSPVGCDAETISSAQPELAARFFHPAEREILASLPEAEAAAGFARLWTLKESYLKATGAGLSRPLNSFCVDLRPEPPQLRETEDAARWRFLSILEDGCACALCCAADAEPQLRRAVLRVRDAAHVQMHNPPELRSGNLVKESSLL
ncbi:MAG: 4'-phosphopantetheinyl transferase superfamily protein [Oscillospiraceae bacterium]|nr:4'-phosphopantetheinyl transferase superfamily protein [Oscillospiraceae bacterium]